MSVTALMRAIVESPGVSTFDTIHPVERPEPAEGPETTRIQFRLAGEPHTVSSVVCFDAVVLANNSVHVRARRDTWLHRRVANHSTFCQVGSCAILV
jgi:hypothetical protein